MATTRSSPANDTKEWITDEKKVHAPKMDTDLLSE